LFFGLPQYGVRQMHREAGFVEGRGSNRRR